MTDTPQPPKAPSAWPVDRLDLLAFLPFVDVGGYLLLDETPYRSAEEIVLLTEVVHQAPSRQQE